MAQWEVVVQASFSFAVEASDEEAAHDLAVQALHDEITEHLSSKMFDVDAECENLDDDHGAHDETTVSLKELAEEC